MPKYKVETLKLTPGPDMHTMPVNSGEIGCFLLPAKLKRVPKWRLTGQFKQQRFWTTHVNRKWAFFSFNTPWRDQICMAKCLYSYRDDLPKNFFKIAAQECKKSTSGWRASLKNVAARTPYKTYTDSYIGYLVWTPHHFTNAGDPSTSSRAPSWNSLTFA